MINKNLKYITCIIITLIFMKENINAQSSSIIRNFADLDKLSSNQVLDFYQDSYGFIWIATYDGLNRYDGQNVKIYKNFSDDKNSLPDNATLSIIEDKQKNLWVACYNVIGKLDRKTDKFKRYSLDHLLSKAPVICPMALLDDKGNVWFAASKLGVLKFNNEKDIFEQIKLSENNNNVEWGEVLSIVQMKNGVIIAADYSNGIKIYNNETNKFDRLNLKPGFSPKKIGVIHKSKSGDIWFGGDNKLIKYSPSQYVYNEYSLSKFSKVKSKYHQVYSIVEDEQNNLWISYRTHGLLKIDKNIEKAEQFLFSQDISNGLNVNTISKLYKDEFDIIWIASINGGIKQLDLNANSFVFNNLNVFDEGFNNQTGVTEIENLNTNKQELIFGTSSEGLVRFNKKTKKMSKVISNNKSKDVSNANINALKIDISDNIWFAKKESGLSKYDNFTKKTNTFYPKYFRNIALPMDINSININPNGEVWICSNLGIDIFSIKNKKFKPLPRLLNKKVDNELMLTVRKITNDRKPISTILKVGEGANIDTTFEINQKQKVLLISVGEGRSLQDMMYDYGSIFDYKGNSIWAFDNFTNSYYSGGGFKNRISFKCIELDKGNYKLHYQSDVGHSYGEFNTVATPDSNWWGIQAFGISDSEFTKIKKLNRTGINKKGFLSFEAARVVEFSKKYSNSVWIGTVAHSFYKYNYETGNIKQYNFNSENLSDASNYINSIYEDSDGTLWVGTYASLIRLNTDTDELNVFTTRDGLPGGIIKSIIEDDIGSLWINSSGGLSKLNKNAPIDKYVFVNYDSKDGLGVSSQSYDVLKDDNGNIYYGNIGGIISFTPGEVNTTKPEIVVSDFKIDDISIFTDSSNVQLNQSIFDTEQIELNYNQNSFSFEFLTIHFSRPTKNKIFYKLEGFSKKWYESNRNFASFTNLDPGEYIFKVKGSNADGIWNENGKSIAITIYPPWWQTTLAYIGYGLLFLLLIFTADRVQRRKLLFKAQERMKIQNAEHRAETAELQAKAAEAQSKVIQAENERKTIELEEARELQLSMLPKKLPQLPNLDIAVYMQTATEVGGDYYDYHVHLDGSFTIVLGDATGHGMQAGMMVSIMKSLFMSDRGNKELLPFYTNTNSAIKDMNLGRLMMALTAVQFEGKTITTVNAGMPPILLFNNKKEKVEELTAKSMPLGAIKNFPYAKEKNYLEQGDTILLLSDGLPELSNEDGKLFGYNRTITEFHSVGEKEPEEIVDHLKKTASQWVNGKDPEDDVTFVVIKVK